MMENPINHIVRCTKPTKLDHVPYGTRWTYQHEDDIEEHYVQLSKKESTPNWTRLGAILEGVFAPACEDIEFLHNICDMYEQGVAVEIETPLVTKNIN